MHNFPNDDSSFGELLPWYTKYAIEFIHSLSDVDSATVQPLTLLEKNKNLENKTL